jgi:hypothetical protein
MILSHYQQPLLSNIEIWKWTPTTEHQATVYCQPMRWTGLSQNSYRVVRWLKALALCDMGSSKSGVDFLHSWSLTHSTATSHKILFAKPCLKVELKWAHTYILPFMLERYKSKKQTVACWPTTFFLHVGVFLKKLIWPGCGRPAPNATKLWGDSKIREEIKHRRTCLSNCTQQGDMYLNSLSRSHEVGVSFSLRTSLTLTPRPKKG